MSRPLLRNTHDRHASQFGWNKKGRQSEGRERSNIGSRKTGRIGVYASGAATVKSDRATTPVTVQHIVGIHSVVKIREQSYYERQPIPTTRCLAIDHLEISLLMTRVAVVAQASW